MKKFFTLICAMICAVAANAASVDDIAVCKHNYVMVCDDYTGNGGVARVKGSLFGDGFFLDVTGGSIATNKQQINLADSAWCVDMPGYDEYGKHYNSLRLKNAQDVIACKVNEGTKIIVLGQAHSSRYALFSSTADMKNELPGQTGAANSMIATYTAQKDNEVVYIGSYNGDYFISYVIIEANEPLGTPAVKVGPQTYEGGLWFKEVTCTPKAVVEEGESLPTYCTYSINGGEAKKYEAPIKVYNDAKVAFQAYYEWDEPVEGAENEAVVSFKFDAPKVVCENGVVTVTSEYEGAKNMISLNGGAYEEASTKTLAESAIVTAKSVIVNGSYTTFETMPTSIDALVLTPITEEVTVNVTGTAVVDEEATATSTTGPVYMVQDGSLNINKAQFFDKGCQFKAIASADAKNAKYQIDGKEAYLMFGNDSRLYFEIGCDSVDVEVICSKNSCKTLNEDDDETVTTDRKCFVNVSGTTYGFDNCTYKENGKDVDTWTPAAEIKTTINFGLTKGSYYFAKYSGTGNILISSIKITPATSDAIKNVTTSNAASKFVKTIENGQLVIKSAKGTFNVAGAQIK